MKKITPIILILIKFSIFYYLIDLNLNDLPVLLLSLGYISLIIFFIQPKTTKNKTVIFSIYTILSLIMYIDAYHYNYFHQLTTILEIKQANQLTAISESIAYLMNPIYLLLFLDLPFIYYYLFKTEIKFDFSTKKWTKPTVGITALIAIIFLITNPINSNTITKLQNNELITYHLTDIYNLNNKNKIKDFSLDTFIEKNLSESDKPSELFGIAEERNIIVIQVESLQNFPINRKYQGQVLTPNLNELIKEDTIYFPNYYQQLGKGNTSDAEFVSHNSLYPAIHGQSYDLYTEKYFYGLPNILKDKGYETLAIHGYKPEFWNRDKAYPAQGLDRFISEQDFKYTNTIGFGIPDGEFFNQSIPILKDTTQPFYSFIITLSSHHPYTMDEKYQYLKLNSEHKETLFGNYLQAVKYVDESIGKFIKELKENDLYNDSMIVIYGDHFGLNSKDAESNTHMTKFLGYDYNYDEMMRIPLIINIPGASVNRTIETAGGQIDFMPTMLNLMGIRNPNPFTFGQDLVNAESGFVASQTYMLEGSFITDDIIFEMSRDGVFKNSKAWSIKTREPVELDLCRPFYERAIEEIQMSNYILENDILKQVIFDNVDLKNLEKKQEIVPEKFIAHAGGRIGEYDYTNAKEALDQSYNNGYKFIEVDFEYTTDDEVVLLHSWDGFVTKFFGGEPKKYSLEEFKSFEMINDWTQMTLNDLALWMMEHPETHIVTDTKEKNIELLTKIGEEYPKIQERIIPQIYTMDEYVRAKYLGYKDIIFTLYRSQYTDEEIVDFAKHHKLLAITMPTNRAKTKLPKELNAIDVYTYTHTINDQDSVKILESYGIDGFYTDVLKPR